MQECYNNNASPPCREYGIPFLQEEKKLSLQCSLWQRFRYGKLWLAHIQAKCMPIDLERPWCMGRTSVSSRCIAWLWTLQIAATSILVCSADCHKHASPVLDCMFQGDGDACRSSQHGFIRPDQQGAGSSEGWLQWDEISSNDYSDIY